MVFKTGTAILMLGAVLVFGGEARSFDEAAAAGLSEASPDCPGCDLAGADLSNRCVRGGNLSGARFDGAKLLYACMSEADYEGASFRDADLTGANLSRSTFAGADLHGAVLSVALIRGADLSGAKGLTQAQIDAACGDADTRLPVGLEIRICE